jgi:hypothetical protein
VPNLFCEPQEVADYLMTLFEPSEFLTAVRSSQEFAKRHAPDVQASELFDSYEPFIRGLADAHVAVAC